MEDVPVTISSQDLNLTEELKKDKAIAYAGAAAFAIGVLFLYLSGISAGTEKSPAYLTLAGLCTLIGIGAFSIGTIRYGLHNIDRGVLH